MHISICLIIKLSIRIYTYYIYIYIYILFTIKISSHTSEERSFDVLYIIFRKISNLIIKNNSLQLKRYVNRIINVSYRFLI